MSEPERSNQVVRFGEFEIDRQACELRRNGRRIPLQIQPFRVLQVLVDHAGEVVTRATLSASIWPGTVYLDFDHGLNNAINRLRQALGDSGDNPVFIETLPRIGYRFIHPLDSAATGQADPPRNQQPPILASRIAMAILAIVVVGTATLAINRWSVTPRAAVPAVAPLRSSKVAGAQEAYLRGMKLIEKRNKESLQLAIEQLQLATRLDPHFAPAFAQLAEAYAGAGGGTMSRFMSADEALKPALTAAEQALRLDPQLGQAHIALARVLNGLQPWSRPTDLAIEESFRRGLDLEPGNADAHLQFGNFLSKRGRDDEAMTQYRRAAELDPLSPSVNSRLGMALMGAGRTSEGLDLLRKTVELEPFQFNARVRLGWCYVTAGDLDAAQREFVAAERISPNSVQSLSSLAYIAARQGDAARARALLGDVRLLADKAGDPSHVAIVYVGLRDREHAIEWLTRTVRQTRVLHGNLPWGMQSSIYDWLRDDPRFRQLAQEVEATMTRGQGEPAP